jgi:hypothetical protein
MVVTMKNAIFWDVMPCGSCKNRISEECITSIIRVTRISALGTTIAVTSNQSMQHSATYMITHYSMCERSESHHMGTIGQSTNGNADFRAMQAGKEF